jgi:hypothetical protein
MPWWFAQRYFLLLTPQNKFKSSFQQKFVQKWHRYNKEKRKTVGSNGVFLPIE